MKEKISKEVSSSIRKAHASPNTRHLDTEEEESIVAQIEDNPYRSQSVIHEESHFEKLWKRELYLVMEDPSSSRMALAFNLVLAGVILFSVVLTTIETIPAVLVLQWTIWSRLELVTVALFTIELALRTAAHSGSFDHLMSFLMAPLTLLDMLAVLPYYVTLLFRHDTSVEFRFTILRVFRLFRLFRAYKYSSLLQLSIEVMLIAVRKSLDALGALFFFMIITIVLFSTFLYFAERGVWDVEKKAFINGDGRISTFDSIPAAFWFVIVTITTTGYGDIVPSTFLGKLIAFPLMMLGILLIALPSVIVGRNFTVVWDVLKHRRHGKNDQSLNQMAPRHSLSDMMEGIELDLASDPRVTQDGRICSISEQSSKNYSQKKLLEEILSHLVRIQSQQDSLGLQLKALHDQSAFNERQIALCTQLLATIEKASSP
ncbi:hypothetical protein L0F63_000641 [Massospora cicadina]|nr:hypothetical protein L0F63_000641 [Massospora cicadina]